jgi:hypothetical protein
MSETKDDPVPVLDMRFAMEQVMGDEGFLEELIRDALDDEALKTGELLDTQKKIEQRDLSLQPVFHEMWRFRRFTEKKYPSSDS